jgi:hypothetical protein
LKALLGRSATRGVGSPVVAITHYPPVDDLGTQRLRDATVAWAALLGELLAVGLRPYLELEQGQGDDPLRLFCELDDGLLLDVALGDEGLPDEPADDDERYWTAFVQDDDGYLAEVTIDPAIDFRELAAKLRDLVDAVDAGERPFLDEW